MDKVSWAWREQTGKIFVTLQLSEISRTEKVPRRHEGHEETKEHGQDFRFILGVMILSVLCASLVKFTSCCRIKNRQRDRLRPIRVLGYLLRMGLLQTGLLRTSLLRRARFLLP